MSKRIPYLIIGGGLSGLYCALRLHQKKLPFILLEARERLGGRIFCESIDNSSVDMGPAWVWPQLQPRLARLCNELDVKIFKQRTQGDQLYEQSPENIQRYSSPSSHQQSYRISGGAQSLIYSIYQNLAGENIQLNTVVTKVNLDTLEVEAKRNNQLEKFSPEHIIQALPLRLAARTISFTPSISKDQLSLWQNTSTWMAGHCKILFIYKTPFWREQGLSGEVFSRHGPLSEIYDGSPVDESFYALTSFVGLPAPQRQLLDPEQLIQDSLDQLQRLFGKEALNTQNIFIKDWSKDRLTACDLDITSPAEHPQLAENFPRHLSDKKIILAGTETAREHGGYIEGALESAEEALSLLNIN